MTVDITDPSNYSMFTFATWTGSKYLLDAVAPESKFTLYTDAVDAYLVVEWVCTSLNGIGFPDNLFVIEVFDGPTVSSNRVGREPVTGAIDCSLMVGIPQLSVIPVSGPMELIVFAHSYPVIEITSIKTTGAQDFFWTKHTGQVEYP